jgi:hypothetical protein
LGIPYDPDFGFFVSNWTKFDIYENTKFGSARAVNAKVIYQYLAPWFNNILPRPVSTYYVAKN